MSRKALASGIVAWLLTVVIVPAASALPLSSSTQVRWLVTIGTKYPSHLFYLEKKMLSLQRSLSISVVALMCLAAFLGPAASTFAQSAISWDAASNSGNVADVNIETGSEIIHAFNGGSADVVIAGINFQGADFVSLPAGVSFEATNASTGSSPRAGNSTAVYDGQPITSTGNAGYDALLGSLSWVNGTPAGISSGNMVFSNLVSGGEYQIQIWFNDQRGFADDRVMRFGDGGASGNTASLLGGDPAAGVQTNAYGQNVVGYFTATGSSQIVSMESVGFGNLHFNAMTLQKVADPVGPIVIEDSQWDIDSQAQWFQATGSGSNYVITNGTAGATISNAVFESVVQQFAQKQKFENLTFKQTPDWVGGQWLGQGNLGPASEPDAPVVLSIGDNDYWYFNRATGSGREYHGWHSTDMVNWTSVGNVMGTDGTNPGGAVENGWTTTAEFKAGVGGARDQILLYYDQPNDHDPHVMSIDIIAPGQLDLSSRIYHGQVLQDASGNDIQTPGSDMAIFRNLDGVFHMIHEDWSAINAQAHSWDSQLAGHASSFDGINGYVYNEHPRVIDETGDPVLDTSGNFTFATGNHPNRNYTYQVHENLDAWGDYEMIRVGDNYYLFADDHPGGGSIGLGYWYSNDIDGPFTYGGKIKDGFHPDPGVMFAEGEFQMFVQASQDFSSSGPWVEGVEAQAGVDTDGDGVVDVWTAYQAVDESYFHIDGFAKVYGVNDAVLDLSSLPEGYGLQFRFRSDDTLAVFDSVALQSAPSAILLGDVNRDGVVNFLDIFPFISVLAASGFQDEADVNQDGVVTFLDISHFIVALSSQ